ncbi:hypothetical protein J3458_001096 [Metarhizium acridum]|uniref:uncharacterized protein n=1 Tax=Metarhizium acridum TaxID=92637 RepID=UPI001C6B2C4F|nr:hypothetical protein J3458_018701 [Metarhizium acridum]KAG8424291.1 hypothetical protein J3458_001096 [Metarhizium acridum]
MEPNQVSQDEFFSKLDELFTQRKGASHGAVYLTQKRLMSHTEEDTMEKSDAGSDQYPTGPMPVLIRASNGKSKRNRSDKIKMSTIVEPHDLDSFYTRFADICKSGMVALKPRDRSKKKAKAKKKKAAS